MKPLLTSPTESARCRFVQDADRPERRAGLVGAVLLKTCLFVQDSAALSKTRIEDRKPFYHQPRRLK